ncbi:phage major capsid protein [Rhodoferax ferrireducens]|uniref:phage major capsid family protein n=1 Tax=Rhodoferax ferrireducens TaxID=192843 RepID=UPI00298D9CD3|nr:phage major capsid protein [Rhodoferax ferrireducens]WPC65674.1 phage major capsid protein [Rhodoferax ferrireducens]
MSDQILLALKGVESKLTSCDLEQRVLADRLTQLEQKGVLLTGEGVTKNGSSLGDLFLKSFDQNRELFEKTRSVRLELKAASDAITTSSGRTIASGGVGAPGATILGLQSALPTRPTGGTSAVEYSRYTGQEGAAAQQSAEGDAKAAVKPTHSLITQTGLTIAGYSKMSKQALSDSSELKRSVDITLSRSVGTALDVALVNGAVGFAGGFETLATASTSLIYTGLVDAISEGVSVMQTAGFNPNVAALNPVDWLAILVAKGTANDHYLSGNYLGAMPSEMRGLKVILSPSVDAGKALLLDSAHSELLIVNNFTVEIGYVNADFTSNLVSILGEMRVIPVFRTVGSAMLITPKP